MYIKFLNSSTPVEAAVVPQGSVVTLKFQDKAVVNLSGFHCYLDKDCEYDIGGKSYETFTNLYRNDEETGKYNGYQLSNDGSVWTKPLPKVTFQTNGGGTLEGGTVQEVHNYEELVIPTPVANENYEFTKWEPEIPESGGIKGNKEYTAIFTSTLPEPEPEPTLEERVATVEEQNAMLTECVLEMSAVVYA